MVARMVADDFQIVAKRWLAAEFKTEARGPDDFFAVFFYRIMRLAVL